MKTIQNSDYTCHKQCFFSDKRPYFVYITNMRILLFVIGLASTAICNAQRSPSFQPNHTDSNSVIDSLKLRQETVLNDADFKDIYTCLGYSSFLQFPKNIAMTGIVAGSANIVEIIPNEKQKSITLVPKVLQGETNMTILLDGKPHNFLIHVIPQGNIKFSQTFTYPYLTDDSGVAVSFGPAVRPQDIDTNHFIAEVEKMGKPGYNQSPFIERVHLKLIKSWNDTIVEIVSAYGFPKDNLIILKVLRRNLSDRGSYLHASQIKVYSANKYIPTTVARQSRPDLYAGEMDTIYLFMQGYNIRAHQIYSFQLPPATDQVEKLLR